VRQHCTVALGGDGGDELFGGYTHYPRLARLCELAGWIPLPLRRAVASGATVALPVGVKGRNWLQAFGTDLTRGVPLIASYFDRRARARLLNGSVGAQALTAAQIREELLHSEGDLVDRATRTDFRLYLAEDILVKVDRASMLHSLEVRAPFLDYRIVEFAFGRVPSRLKANAHGRKILLKRLAARILPTGFDPERKQGFSIPLAAWLRDGPWLRFFREVLLDGTDGLFNRRYLERLLDGQARGRSNSERLFALVLFELWRREYGVTM
jgi:asparagine synthase (glutamine-hydrolysing)